MRLVASIKDLRCIAVKDAERVYALLPAIMIPSLAAMDVLSQPNTKAMLMNQITSTLKSWRRAALNRLLNENQRRDLYYKRKLRDVSDRRSMTAVFETIYEKNLWDSPESRSGPGSELEYTAPFRAALEDWAMRHANEVRVFLDAPSGDFNWMRHVRLPEQWMYIGGDVVRPMVANLQAQYGDVRHQFVELDIVEAPLPQIDAWLCRDVLFHLPFAKGRRVIDRWRASGASWFLSTTFPGVANDHDIPLGHFRQIDLETAPYGLGKPVELLPDDPVSGVRFVGVWKNDR